MTAGLKQQQHQHQPQQTKEQSQYRDGYGDCKADSWSSTKENSIRLESTAVARLYVRLNGPENVPPKVVSYPIYVGKNLIGKGPKCNIQIEDNFVSTKHCIIFVKDGFHFIKDLKTTNGTFFGNQQVEMDKRCIYQLQNGNVLAISECLAFYEIIEEEEQSQCWAMGRQYPPNWLPDECRKKFISKTASAALDLNPIVNSVQNSIHNSVGLQQHLTPTNNQRKLKRMESSPFPSPKKLIFQRPAEAATAAGRRFPGNLDPGRSIDQRHHSNPQNFRSFPGTSLSDSFIRLDQDLHHKLPLPLPQPSESGSTLQKQNSVKEGAPSINNELVMPTNLGSDTQQQTDSEIRSRPATPPTQLEKPTCLKHDIASHIETSLQGRTSISDEDDFSMDECVSYINSIEGSPVNQNKSVFQLRIPLTNTSVVSETVPTINNATLTNHQQPLPPSHQHHPPPDDKNEGENDILMDLLDQDGESPFVDPSPVTTQASPKSPAISSWLPSPPPLIFPSERIILADPNFYTPDTFLSKYASDVVNDGNSGCSFGVIDCHYTSDSSYKTKDEPNLVIALRNLFVQTTQDLDHGNDRVNTPLLEPQKIGDSHTIDSNKNSASTTNGGERISRQLVGNRDQEASVQTTIPFKTKKGPLTDTNGHKPLLALGSASKRNPTLTCKTTDPQPHESINASKPFNETHPTTTVTADRIKITDSDTSTNINNYSPATVTTKSKNLSPLLISYPLPKKMQKRRKSNLTFNRHRNSDDESSSTQEDDEDDGDYIPSQIIEPESCNSSGNGHPHRIADQISPLVPYYHLNQHYKPQVARSSWSSRAKANRQRNIKRRSVEIPSGKNEEQEQEQERKDDEIEDLDNIEDEISNQNDNMILCQDTSPGNTKLRYGYNTNTTTTSSIMAKGKYKIGLKGKRDNQSENENEVRNIAISKSTSSSLLTSRKSVSSNINGYSCSSNNNNNMSDDHGGSSSGKKRRRYVSVSGLFVRKSKNNSNNNNNNNNSLVSGGINTTSTVKVRPQLQQPPKPRQMVYRQGLKRITRIKTKGSGRTSGVERNEQKSCNSSDSGIDQENDDEDDDNTNSNEDTTTDQDLGPIKSNKKHRSSLDNVEMDFL
ncbi:hypothetical protein H4219_004652 [Mycoemilia scoparia]|uniref:FHA domain-containing protein n=1 Tax=Mycoemilia scoparia TaxID=417184 RepID=A0A9W7ZZ24_9FUNG|nr:hypothetical protein H4219_004652 [Mycoemilia scoparia]